MTTYRNIRSRAAVAGVAATALAAASLALTTTATEAAPTPPSGTVTKGYAGAPVNPAPYTLTQPDGSTIEVRNVGDALTRGVVTARGGNALVQGKDGFWRYATSRGADGGLVASAVVAGAGRAPAAAKGLAPAPTAAATAPRTPKAGRGDDKALVILAQFSDQAAVGSTQAQWADSFFGASGSVDAFYNQASSGTYGLAPAADTSGTVDNGVVGWVTLPYPHPNGGVDPTASEDYIVDAVEAADPFVDFASFDTDGDGNLDTDELHITVITAGYETSYSGEDNVCGPSTWGHQWDLDSAGVVPASVDGVTAAGSGYTTFGEWHCDTTEGNPGHRATIGIMAHEIGHDINWPDLYDVDYSSSGVGYWSLMASGSWSDAGGEPGSSPSLPDAWSRWYQGWVTPTTVAAPTDNLPLNAGQVALVSPNPGGVDWVFGEQSGAGEYFLVENRALTGFDASLPGCGLVAYRIDETVTASNGANSDEDDPLVAVLQADGSRSLYYGTTYGGSAGDPYPGTSGNQDLDATSAPSTAFHTGQPSGLDVHVDSTACGSPMVIDVTPGAGSPEPVRPANDAFAAATALTGASGSVAQSTSGATDEAGEPSPDGVGAASVWFSWTAPATGSLTVSTAGSDYDTVLGLYTGSAVNALTEVAVNDDAAGLTSQVVSRVTAGTTYKIAADGYGGDTGALVLGWALAADPTPTVTPTVVPTVVPPPVTPTTPAAVITVTKPGVKGKATVGRTLKAKPGTVTPAGVKVSYRWLRNGTTIRKATKAKYTVVRADKGKKLSLKITYRLAGFPTVTKKIKVGKVR